VTPSEHAACSGTASVLPPAPTILISHVHTNREPARRETGGEKSGDDGEKSYDDGGEDEVEGKGKGQDKGDSDKDGGEGEGRDEDNDEDMDEEEDAPVVRSGRFGPLRGHSGSGQVNSVTRYPQDAAEAIFTSNADGNIFIFVTVILFLLFCF
jgi:hypothetical protein